MKPLTPQSSVQKKKTPIVQNSLVGQSSSNSPKSQTANILGQNRYSPLAVTPTYSELIQRRVVLPPITPSKKDTMINLGSSKLVSKPQILPQKTKSSNTYITNPNEQFVKVLEPEEILALKTSFSKCLERAFPSDSFYIGCKPRAYYEAILEDTNSMKITHIKNPDQGSSYSIDYSKACIFRVLSQKDWGLKPFQNRTLSNYPQMPGFNYYDYQDAWFNVFYLRCFSHSWFVFFDKDFDFSHGYPEWMVGWFSKIGHIIETFPNQVRDGFLKFKELFPQNISDSEHLLQFIILFKIPWICTWKFIIKEDESISKTSLYRIINVKWWDKLPKDQMKKMTIQGVIDYCTHSKDFSTSLESICPTAQTTLSNEDKELQLLLNAPTPEDIRRIYQEIKRGTSSSTNSDDNKSINLHQDAQDPFCEYSPYD